METERIRVLLDVSPACAPGFARTGLARVALQLASALATRPDVELRVVAWGWVQAAFDLKEALVESPVSLRSAGVAPGVVERAFSRQWERFRDRGNIPGWFVRIGRALNIARNPVRGLDSGSFDIVHSTYSRMPRHVRRWKKPVVLTLHDLTPLKLNPQLVPKSQARMIRRIVNSVQPSDWLVPISNHTRMDFEEISGLHPADRISVIPDAVDSGVFKPVVDAATISEVRQKLRIPQGPFFLSMSSLAPHKNIRFLVRLWARVRMIHPDAHLVVAGGKTVDRASVESEFGADAGVHFTGFITDAALAALLSSCEAFLFPSLYEGFGLPVLEAMACGAPVIASNRSAIPEVMGGAGTLLDPEDSGAWVAAIAGAVSSGPRLTPHEPSIRQASRFGWDKVAAEYVALYRRALSR